MTMARSAGQLEPPPDQFRSMSTNWRLPASSNVLDTVVPPGTYSSMLRSALHCVYPCVASRKLAKKRWNLFMPKAIEREWQDTTSRALGSVDGLERKGVRIAQTKEIHPRRQVSNKQHCRVGLHLKGPHDLAFGVNDLHFSPQHERRMAHGQHVRSGVGKCT